MSKIKGKNTGIEKMLIAELRKRKISGFKRYPNLIGKPDIIFPKAKTVVFCDGDFWHGYQFSKQKHKLNKFWFKKISGNIKRDRLVRRELEKEGWLVIRFWGHEILEDPSACVDRLTKFVVIK